MQQHSEGMCACLHVSIKEQGYFHLDEITSTKSYTSITWNPFFLVS